MVRRVEALYSGQVQGVGFRWCSYEKFTELGLTGRAENGFDGTVEIDVSGEDFALEKFVEWAHTGPSGARVSKVEVSEISDVSAIKQDDNDKNEQD